VLPPEFTPEGIGLAALIAAGTRDGIAILGPDGQLVFWNSAAAAITGWSLAQAAEKSLGNLVKGPEALVEIRDGMWVELRYTRVDANGQTFLILMFTDSTSLMSLRNARHQLQSLGLIDEPTGLPGRDLVLVQLDQAIALAKRDKRSVGVLSLKVDRFRQLRETEDGQVADEVIRQFASRITTFVRGSDVSPRSRRATTRQSSRCACSWSSPNRSTLSERLAPFIAASASRSSLVTLRTRHPYLGQLSRLPTAPS